MNEDLKQPGLTPDDDDLSEEEWLNLPPQELDRKSVEITRWMIETFPAFYEHYRLHMLEPEKYPEDRILADFIIARDKSRSGRGEAG